MDIPKEIKEKARGRQSFYYKDQLIYQWEQTIDEVHIYITPPKGVKLDIKIESSHIQVGIKGNPPYLSENLTNKCVIKESFWTIEDGELHINLQKMYKGEVWNAAFIGHAQLDGFTKEEVQKQLLLERFQQEVKFLFIYLFN